MPSAKKPATDGNPVESDTRDAASGQKETDSQSLAGHEKAVPANHLGSSNAFEETENPASADPDDITDEKLDDLLDK
jgi:hypothetical protein